MASHKVLLITAVAMALAVGALLPATAFPNNHLVGDMGFWNLGVNYDDWARANNPIPAGDTLEFMYTAGDHTVVQVDENAYNNCDVNNNIGFWDSGDDILQLGEPGNYFFICGTGNHCSQGMKLAVIAT
ncbi:unnamed protein product [Urochloa decumbens]|uniref:Phytocyanin domain-containing protein n=1 Tax=Urochloa decumbens TaxID=240449 RepID=A0ABC8VEZ1_9POAL